MVAVVAVVVGSFGWVPVAKIAFTGVNWRRDLEPWRVAGRRIGLLAVANGLLALMITGYPTTVTAVIGSSEGLAIFFAVVTVSRVPLTLLSPVQALVVPTTTKALYEGRGDQLLAMQGKILKLSLGYSHEVNFETPEGVTITSPKQTEIVVEGIDQQLVGQVAANIREWRAPEPYKGKGIRYKGEFVFRKEGKKK